MLPFYQCLTICPQLIIYLKSARKHYDIRATNISCLAALYDWNKELSKIIEQFGLESPETLHALNTISELAQLPFKLSEVTEEELTQVLEKTMLVNFPEKEEKDQPDDFPEEKPEKVTLAEYQTALITNLVNSELAIGLESAIKVSQQLTHVELEACIDARLKFLNRDRIRDEKAARSLVEEVKDGSFFGKVKDGRDPAQEGFLAAMGIKPPKSAKKPSLFDIDQSDIDTAGMPESVKKALSLE